MRKPDRKVAEMKSDQVVAIACADLHLSHTPPIARAGEKSWYEAMMRPLAELRKLAVDLQVPILCAGDVFDKWNAPAELINFALDCLPEMYAIPGQHDLPLHNYRDIHKSAYWTLVKMGRVRNLVPGEKALIQNGLHVTGFPWGFAVKPSEPKNKLNICLHHGYRWIKGAGYEGADAASQMRFEEYKGYDVVIIGDNHKSWEARGLVPSSSYGPFSCIWNAGSLMCRNSDQIDHRPRVGMIRADSYVESRYLDCSKDIISKTTELFKLNQKRFGDDQGIGGREFDSLLEELRERREGVLDYAEALRQAMGSLSPEAGKLLLEALDCDD